MDYSRRTDRTSNEALTGARRSKSRGGARSRTRMDTPSGASSYQLKRHNIRFNNRPSPRGFFARYDSRSLIMIAVAILVLFLLIFGVVGCVRGCTPSEPEKPVNEKDERVAGGVSEAITDKLTVALDNNKKITWIAKHADEYPDDRVIELALREPAAVDFVRNLPGANKRSTGYDEEVERGNYPVLYNFDERWGYIDYAGLPLGVSGSGPTCLSIAYMGLTGEGDQTPADIARRSAEKGFDSGDEYTTAELFTSESDELGLICSQLSLSEDGLLNALYNSMAVICQIRPDTFTTEAHWVIVTGLNENGSARVIDPTSTEVTSHEWDTATVASSSNTMYAIGRGETTEYYE